jgi:(E)-4-hydroxy-3-methylbut-2-enyl-diphosphate synthase
MISRRAVRIGSAMIGGGAPLLVQSMTNTDPHDVEATLAQIERLARAGCEIVRVAVPDLDAAAVLREIRREVALPLVADVHFDHRIALAAVAAGVDKLRLNPGTIADPAKVREVARAAQEAGVAIRVGANSGSLRPPFLGPGGHPTAEGLAESALAEVRLLEEQGFERIVVSVKATDVRMTIDAYRRVAREVDYPLHIGITEAGPPFEGAIRSAVGLGILLSEGLGDTLRVSLAGDPVEEVRAGYEILRSLGLRTRGVTYRVCPTCGRTGIDLAAVAEAVRQDLAEVSEPITVALMGCVVNGLGEVREADVGLVGGKEEGTVYVRGEAVLSRVPEARLAAEVVRAARAFLEERG